MRSYSDHPSKHLPTPIFKAIPLKEKSSQLISTNLFALLPDAIAEKNPVEDDAVKTKKSAKRQRQKLLKQSIVIAEEENDVTQKQTQPICPTLFATGVRIMNSATGFFHHLTSAAALNFQKAKTSSYNPFFVKPAKLPGTYLNGLTREETIAEIIAGFKEEIESLNAPRKR